MSEHRVPLLGQRWRRFEDPEKSRDPQVRVLVEQLQSLSAGPPPEPAFRAELRAQLVAIAPRMIAEGIAEQTTMVDITSPAAAATTPRATTAAHAPATRRFRPARVLGVATSLVVAFALLLGGAVLMSRKAVPGDTLYGLKRASEQFQLDTAGSDTARASDLLRFASTRTDEVKQLIGNAGPSSGTGTFSASQAALITSTLQSANSDTADASRLLGSQAVHDGSATPLTSMTNWAPSQLARLKAIWASLPDGSLRSAASRSVQLVTSAQSRARALISSVSCVCSASARPTTSVPTPCTVCPSTTTKAPATSTSTATTPATSPGKLSKAPAGHPNLVSPTSGTQVTTPAVTPKTSAGTAKRSTGVLPPLPSLPPLLPSKAPVAVKSCGVTVNLLGVTINLGTCPPTP